MVNVTAIDPRDYDAVLSAMLRPTATLVRFKKSIDEESFVERGMVGWLVGYEIDNHTQCWNLHFNFADFRQYNEKYMRRVYHPNKYTREKVSSGLMKERQLYTAYEADMVEDHVSIYFSDSTVSKERMLSDLLEFVEVIGSDTVDCHPIPE